MKQITTKTVYFNNRGELAEFARTDYVEDTQPSDVKTMAELEAENTDGFRNPTLTEQEYQAARLVAAKKFAAEFSSKRVETNESAPDNEKKDDGYDYDKYY